MDRLIRVDEWNAGAPLQLLSAAPTPLDAFYTRSNFGVPDVDGDSWHLAVDGLVASPRTFSIDELRGLGASSELVTVECAGNGRLFMEPVPDGTPWGLGAISVGEFTGVPLGAVLDLVEPRDEVTEFVFTGADRGVVEPEGEINYAFSLEAMSAVADGPMLVWEMNGEPLTAEHGAPLRLVVPASYGMCSVKWLTRITAVDEPFDGHFRLKYRYYGDRDELEEAPVGAVRVRALITTPEEGSTTGTGLEVKGVAWSGEGGIASVAVRVDDGEWFQAILGPQQARFAPTPWSAKVSLEPGTHLIAARATDEQGRAQPLTPVWNRNGYANNVVHRIEISTV